MREFQATVDNLSREGMPPGAWGASQNCLRRPSVRVGCQSGRHVQKLPCANALVRRTGLSAVSIDRLLTVAEGSESGVGSAEQCRLLKALAGAHLPDRALQKPARVPLLL